jgi:hypothetical protein
VDVAGAAGPAPATRPADAPVACAPHASPSPVTPAMRPVLSSSRPVGSTAPSAGQWDSQTA